MTRGEHREGNRNAPKEEDVTAHLRSRGYAVVVWTTEELRGTSASVVEDIGIERMSGVLHARY